MYTTHQPPALATVDDAIQYRLVTEQYLKGLGLRALAIEKPTTGAISQPSTPIVSGLHINPDAEELRRPRLREHRTLPKWNYTILPNL